MKNHYGDSMYFDIYHVSLGTFWSANANPNFKQGSKSFLLFIQEAIRPKTHFFEKSRTYDFDQSC